MYSTLLLCVRLFVQVCAPLYPKSKTEAWWVVVGDKKKNTLLAIKRVTLQRKTRAKLEFAAPDEVGGEMMFLRRLLGADHIFFFARVPVSVCAQQTPC